MEQAQDKPSKAKPTKTPREGGGQTGTTETRHRQVVRGVVVSDKMNKTRIIELKRTIRHRLYAKNLVRSRRLFVHDEKNESKVGDVVSAISTRPLSRHKNFRMLKILEKKVAQ